MTNTTEELKQILENAPFDTEYVHAAIADDGKTVLTRSLSDIREIVRLSDENQKLRERVEKLESDLIGLGSQKHFYAVTYGENLMHVSISESNANKYSDKFGGVYGVVPVDMEYAFNVIKEDC